MSPDRGALDAALIAAHASGDQRTLVTLYADAAAGAGDEAAERFFLTQAYVFALATGDPAASALHARLLALGAEE